MNEFVELAGLPELMPSSLIFTGLTFRTFWAVVSERVRPEPVQAALPTRSPLKAAGPGVTWNVAVMLAPGATDANVLTVSVDPETTAVHPAGTARFSRTP